MTRGWILLRPLESMFRLRDDKSIERDRRLRTPVPGLHRPSGVKCGVVSSSEILGRVAELTPIGLRCNSCVGGRE
jgi:hypothetical protein